MISKHRTRWKDTIMITETPLHENECANRARLFNHVNEAQEVGPTRVSPDIPHIIVFLTENHGENDTIHGI